MISHKTLLVFDIDGTLTDSIPMHELAYKEALLDIGIDVMQVKVQNFKHHTDSYILNEIYKIFHGKNMPSNEVKSIEQIFYDKIKKHEVTEIPGAKNLIHQINKNERFDICFATGSLLRPAKYKLNSVGINYRENLLEAADNIYDRESIVSNAIKKAKETNIITDYKKIISVGDGYWDLKTAQNLGIDFIGIGLTHLATFIENGADKVYEDLTHIHLDDL